MVNITSIGVLTLYTMCWKITEGAKILGIFPTPSISHQVAFRPLMKELARRGHNVTVVTTDPEFKGKDLPQNFTEIDVHDKSYAIWRKGFVELINEHTDFLSVFAAAVSLRSIIFEEQVKVKEFDNILKRGEKFDLVITEVWSTAAIAVGVKLKAPVIQISSMAGLRYLYEQYGVPNHRLLYPELSRTKINNLSIIDKIKELYYGEKHHLIYSSGIKIDGKLQRKLFGENLISTYELLLKPDLLLLNVHPIWIQNRPVPPNVIFIGGIHQNPKKDLPEELLNYLDSSRNGVIYMSFGTNVDTKKLDQKRIKIFCDVFRRMQYDVLWKWNDDTLPWNPDNVKIAKWLPQSDLLRHPKIKVFITQAGMQSTDEAITAAVPLIAFPMLGDQFYNAEMYEYLKIGAKLNFASVTESSLLETLTRVINDESYRDNIIKLNSTINDQLQTSLERAVWWTEYVLRHGGAKHLRSPMANASWAEYLMLDVLFVALVILAVILTSLGYAFRTALKIVFNSDKIKTA